jgi:hypothetical protein
MAKILTVAFGKGCPSSEVTRPEMAPSAGLFVDEGSARRPAGTVEASFVVVSARRGVWAGLNTAIVMRIGTAITAVRRRHEAMAPTTKSKALRIVVSIFATRLIRTNCKAKRVKRNRKK